MGVVFDLYIFVQHLYQAATGFSDQVVNMVAGESKRRQKKKEGVRRAEMKLAGKLKYFSTSMHTCWTELK